MISKQYIKCVHAVNVFITEFNATEPDTRFQQDYYNHLGKYR